MAPSEKVQDEFLRRPMYLYDLPPGILETLKLKTDANAEEEQAADDATPTESPSPPPETNIGAQACSLCGLTFVTFQEQRGHLKSDLHHYNLEQKLRGAKPVSEAEFEKLIGDLDESLSGSDSSEDDEEDEETSKKETTLSALLKKQATLADQKRANGEEDDQDWARKKKRGSGKPPLMWFSSSRLPENTYFGVYRTIFTGRELNEEGSIIDAIKRRQLPRISMPKPAKDGSIAPTAYQGEHIFMCMIGGGHFAAMVVALNPRQTKHGSTGPMNREATVLAHKTFHRYTTRRKQGGSQSANDNAKGAAHSAGSTLRRYNEQALVEDVRELLHDWKTLIDSSTLLFIRATGATNRRTLFGPYEGQVLRANDERIRGFPFSTRRATQNELMRSFIELTRLKVREIVPTETLPVTEPAQKTSASQTPTKPDKQAPPKLSKEEEDALLHTTRLQALVKRSKVPVLLSYLKSNDLKADFRFYPPDHHTPTCLHLAASQNSAPLVTGLLTKGGADPTTLNGEDKTAFELAGDRATRDAFRVARSEMGEDVWDWEAARVPPALSKAQADKRAERERKENEDKEDARRKVEEEKLKAQEPDVGAGKTSSRGGILGAGAPKTAQERRMEEARGLTPEQRMRLERERRARAAEERLRRMQDGG